MYDKCLEFFERTTQCIGGDVCEQQYVYICNIIFVDGSKMSHVA